MTKTIFVCQNCGRSEPRWIGKCPDCESWGTFVEEVKELTTNNKRQTTTGIQSKPVSIAELTMEAEERINTGISELDGVLGGGIVPGSVVLVGGDPGIGKSTLLLQAGNALAKSGYLVLYVTGEESGKQLRMRAERVGALEQNLNILPETNIFVIEEQVKALQPRFVIIDSIQTVFREDITSAPGSVSQLRECGSYLTRMAKDTGIPVFMIGHVTKEGAIAGPKVLEHVVDTVLYFEGERHREFRILRAVKNRFGGTNEIGIFEMRDKGLIPVDNPSRIFLDERAESVPGSVITALLEGSRPFLVELQALVSPSNFGVPRRTVSGVDYNRSSIVVAVLERRLGLHLGTDDIFLNVAGGVKVTETAADLAAAVALVSCFRNKKVIPHTVVFGEVGLGGEVRAVGQVDLRLAEAEKLGFKRCIVPAGNARAVKGKLKVIGVETVGDAVKEALD